MKRNVGTVDRWIRLVLGIVVMALGYRYHAWWGWIGVVVLLTGLFSWCPVYAPFRISTTGKPPVPKTNP